MPKKEVLRTGTFVDAHGKKVQITEKTLDELVKNFDNSQGLNSEGFKVPLFLGHPMDESTAPALGWVKNLFKQGEFLVAEFDKLTDKAVEAISDFSFRDVSVSVFKNILQHIGLTNTPAVSGLSDFQYTVKHKDAETWKFSEEPNNPKGDQTMSDDTIKLVEEKKELEIQLTAANSKVEELTVKLTEAEEKAETAEAEKAEAVEAKEAAEKENEELKTEAAEKEAEAELSRDTSFVEKLVDDGKLTPADKEAVIARLAKFPKEISEGEEKSPKDWYMESLENRDVKIADGEQFANGEKKGGESKLTRLINERMEKANLTHNVAMAQILNENPELNKGE